MHDLAVDMRMDPETAATIRQVSAMKEKAVDDEDYELVRSSACQLRPCVYYTDLLVVWCGWDDDDR